MKNADRLFVKLPELVLLLVVVSLAAVTRDVQAQYAPPAAGLVGWWRGDGNGNDSSGNGHNGTLMDGGGYDAGLFGQAFSFAGNPNRLFIPDSNDFNLTNSLSIGAWIYIKADSWHVLERASTGFVSYSFGLDDAGHFWFVINSRNGQAQLLAPIASNQWKQVIATLDGTTGDMRLYIDGVLVTNLITTVRPATLAVSEQPALAIGNTPYVGGFPFIGLIDEVVMYSRALSPTEVQGLAQRTPSTNCVAAPSGLVSWWPGEGNANDAVDSNNGTLFSGTTFMTGKVGQAFSFDGTNSAVVIAASSNLAFQSLTIEGWILPLDLETPRPIVEYGNATGLSSVDFWYNVGPGISPLHGGLYGIFRAANSSAYVDLGSAPGLLVSNQWSHVAVTYDYAQSIVTLYHNGQAVGVTTSTVPVQPQSFMNVNIGYRPVGSSDLWGGRRHLGGLDEVSIYNRALSASEIQAIYNSGSGGKCSVSPSNCFAFTSFNSTNGLALTGNSATVGGVLRLTPAAYSQQGNAWRTDKQSCSGGFDTRFQFQITAPGSLPGTPSGGDGIAFVVQNVGPVDTEYIGLSSGTNNTAVFFNTFWNWPGCTDSMWPESCLTERR